MKVMKMHFLIVLTIMIVVVLPAWAKDGSFLDIQVVESESGLKAWLVQDSSLPVVAMSFSFLGAGSAQDSAEKQGLSQLASNTMDEGAGDLDSLAFQKELKDKAIELRFQSGRDNFGGTVKTLSQNKARAFELLKMALSEPRFEGDAVDRMREANMARIRRSMTDPDWIAARIMNDVSFAGHPYAQNSGGTLSTLAAITPEDLKGFAKDRLARSNLVVSVAGDMSAEELKALLDDVFGALPDQPILKDVPELELTNQGKLFFYDYDVPQSVISISMPGIDRHDPRYQAAQVMNQIFGASGFGSRLMKEAREKRGLTYGIYSGLSHLNEIDVLTIGTSTKNESVGEMLTVIDQETLVMADSKVTEKELADAKAYLIGTLPLSLTSTDKIAALMNSLQEDALDVDYLDRRQEEIEKTTIADVQEIAKELLHSEKAVRVLVGKAEGLEPDEVVKELHNVE